MTSSQITALFLDVALIVALARAGGAVARRCGQPAVIGEIVAGILLGPTLLHEPIAKTLFPLEVRSELGALADIGLVLFMFALGMEFDWTAKRSIRRTSLAIATCSVVFPFAAGAGIGLWWGPGETEASKLAHSMFMGIALSVTAFPVLARIIEDRGMARTPLGQLALASAALCDIYAWMLLGAVLLLCGSSDAPWRLLWAVPYLIFLATAVRPLLRAVIRKANRELDMVVTFVGLLASSAATEWMGLHFIFGAFALGIVRTAARRGLPEQADTRLRQAIGTLPGRIFMPIYFVVAGWNADLSALSKSQLPDLAVLLLAAVAAKSLAAAGAARLCGLPGRESAAMGALMNTRGLTELIVLTAGRESGLLDDTQYTLLVTMAVLTTISTGPILNRLLRASRPGGETSPSTPSIQPPPAGEPAHEAATEPPLRNTRG
ncbi:cation:proton antiporter [Streptomyces sp. NPDC059900]|uniref:cation:proton antiporter n=1 Tax=Streptomyces sp. NPDC059900 TaxID=3155816 RepID=UPI003437E060